MSAAAASHAAPAPVSSSIDLPPDRPTDYEYAYFSRLAYEPKPEERTQKLAKFIIRGRCEWEAIEHHRDKGDGYEGFACVNRVHRWIVIAHQGTQTLRDWQANVEGVIGQNIVGQQVSAAEFAFKMRADEKYKDYRVSFTGHSLAAWLAILTNYLFHLKYVDSIGELAGKGVFDENEETARWHSHAVVFDSPGGADLLEHLQPTIPTATAKIKQLDVTSWLSHVNLVNTSNGHVGRVFRLFPPISPDHWWKHTVESHSMDAILGTFNKDTGLPDKYVQVTSWPRIKWEVNTSPEGFLPEMIGLPPIISQVAVQTLSALWPQALKPYFQWVRILIGCLNGQADTTQYVEFFKIAKAASAYNPNPQELGFSEAFCLEHKAKYKVKAPDPNFLLLSQCPPPTQKLLLDLVRPEYRSLPGMDALRRDHRALFDVLDQAKLSDDKTGLHLRGDAHMFRRLVTKILKDKPGLVKEVRIIVENRYIDHRIALDAAVIKLRGEIQHSIDIQHSVDQDIQQVMEMLQATTLAGMPKPTVWERMQLEVGDWIPDINLAKMIPFLDQLSEVLKAEGKDLVVLFSDSGTGKSALTSYGMGHELERQGEGAKLKDPRAVGPTMGGLPTSTTHTALMWTGDHPVDLGEGRVACETFADVPGFEHNSRFKEETLWAPISTEIVQTVAKSIRPVIVISCMDIIGSGIKGNTALRGLAVTFSKLFRLTTDSVVNSNGTVSIETMKIPPCLFIATRAQDLPRYANREEARTRFFNSLEMLCTERHGAIAPAFNQYQMAPESERTKLREDLNLTIFQWTLLECMRANPDRVVIVDIFDKGDSRREMLKRLQDLPKADTNSFNYGQTHNNRPRFDRLVAGIAKFGRDLISRGAECCKTIQAHAQMILANRKDIADIDKTLTLLRAADDQEKERILEAAVAEERKKTKETIAGHKSNISKLEDDITKLKKEKKDIENNTTMTVAWQQSHTVGSLRADVTRIGESVIGTLDGSSIAGGRSTLERATMAIGSIVDILLWPTPFSYLHAVASIANLGRLILTVPSDTFTFSTDGVPFNQIKRIYKQGNDNELTATSNADEIRGEFGPFVGAPAQSNNTFNEKIRCFVLQRAFKATVVLSIESNQEKNNRARIETIDNDILNKKNDIERYNSDIIKVKERQENLEAETIKEAIEKLEKGKLRLEREIMFAKNRLALRIRDFAGVQSDITKVQPLLQNIYDLEYFFAVSKATYGGNGIGIDLSFDHQSLERIKTLGRLVNKENLGPSNPELSDTFIKAIAGLL